MEFFDKHKTIVAFIGFTLFCIVSLSVQSSSFTLTIEGIGSALTMPFQKGYDSVQGGVSRIWAGFSELTKTKEELDKTRKRLARYESIAEELGEIKTENSRLRKLLGLKERITYDSIQATIISKDPDNWFRTLIINRGENHGIKLNMPVIAFQGDEKAVVGKIVEVRGSISRIVPIISSNMKMGIKFQSNRFPGLLSGFSTQSSLSTIDYISRAAVIKFNDIVITSGQGGVFPPGLLVGKVLKADISESSAYQKAIVKPFIDYNLVEEVFVIKKDPNNELIELFEERE